MLRICVVILRMNKVILMICLFILRISSVILRICEVILRMNREMLRISVDFLSIYVVVAFLCINASKRSLDAPFICLRIL